MNRSLFEHSAKEVNPNLVKEILRKQGMALLRNAQNSTEDFLEFSQQIGKDFYEKGAQTHQHRQIGGEKGRLCVNGHPSLFWVSAQENRHPLPLHGELYFCSQSPPQLLWFYCAASESDVCPTWVCDGIELFAQLPDVVQKALIGQKVKYHRYFTFDAWQSTFGFEKAEDLKMYLETQGYTFSFGTDGSLSTWFTSNILKKQGNTWAFINNVLPFGLRELREPGSSKATVRFANDKKIPIQILLNIEEKALELKQEIVWQQGDILVIDNMRTLHGRGPINAANRQLYLRMSNADFI